MVAIAQPKPANYTDNEGSTNCCEGQGDIMPA
jgi:hypothetical protein